MAASDEWNWEEEESSSGDQSAEEFGDMFAVDDDYYKPKKQATLATYNRLHEYSGQISQIEYRKVGEDTLWADKLWNAGIVLSDYFDDPEYDFTGKCVLELGAGVGLPGIIAGLKGATLSVITDYPKVKVINNLKYNVCANIPSENRSNMKVMGHLWGNDIDELLEPLHAIGREYYDLIICADCIFNHFCQTDLLKTCDATLAPDGEVFVSFSHHKPSIAFKDLEFFETAKNEFNMDNEKLFERQMVPMYEVDNGPAEVRGRVYTRKLTRSKPQEYLDVLDDEGNLTGRKENRNIVHEQGFNHRAVHVWIIDSQGNLILQQRAAEKLAFPNMWDISAAGHVESGDNSIETASKELHEELGIYIPPYIDGEPNPKFEKVLEWKNHFIINNGTYINNEFIDTYLVEIEVQVEDLVLQKEEVQAAKKIHHTAARQAYITGESDYVPLISEEMQEITPKFFDILEQRYGN
eukprot:TRINITY_DN4832_c0_g1_i1.p2 TRINITY_DN4832_c0_g1~~TRINITY_DN4832_c0_g1_i1.p2  ORF type:complete len:466 (+),score=135.81 TRINITY_DN4832_c0_g1_i1:22-1419(+)